MPQTIRTAAEIDFRVHNHGSIFLLEPTSEAGRIWIAEHVTDATWWCGKLVVEHRYIGDLVSGVIAEGHEVHHV